jgi:voltage-gated potassium channel Kch
MSFGFFVYFSTITIGTVGYGEVVPGHWITRTLVSIEVVTGIIWVVVYFAFLMRKLSEGA